MPWTEQPIQGSPAARAVRSLHIPLLYGKIEKTTIRGKHTMKASIRAIFDELYTRYPALTACKEDIEGAAQLMIEGF